MDVVIFFNDINMKYDSYTDAFIFNEGEISASIEEPKCFMRFEEWIEEQLIPHERDDENEIQDQYDNVYTDYWSVTYRLSIRDYLKFLKTQHD